MANRRRKIKLSRWERFWRWLTQRPNYADQGGGPGGNGGGGNGG